MHAIDVRQHCDALDRLGFTTIRAAIPASAASEMRVALQSLLLERGSNWELPLETIVPKIVERHDVFRRAAVERMVTDVVGGAMGSDIHLVLNQGHLKPARTRSHTAVHSDLLHLRGVDHANSLLMIKCMIALTPIGDGDGGLCVFPASQKLRHESYPPRPAGAPTYLPMRPGDAVLFNAAMLHSATNNDSDRPRLSIWFAYAHTWMRHLPGFEPSAAFLNEMEASCDAHAKQIFGLSEPYATGAAVALPARVAEPGCERSPLVEEGLERV